MVWFGSVCIICFKYINLPTVTKIASRLEVTFIFYQVNRLVSTYSSDSPLARKSTNLIF